MDTDLRESKRLEQILRDFHLEGALFGYDDGHAQNRKALTDRIPFIIRSRSPASRRDADRAGRPALSGASLSFSGIARECEATRGGERTAAGLRRGYLRRELRAAECCRGRVLGRF